MIPLSELHLPGIISSVLFSVIAAWSLCIPFFTAPRTDEPAGASPEAGAANYSACIDEIVRLEGELRAGRVSAAEHSEKTAVLRRRAAELKLLERQGEYGG